MVFARWTAQRGKCRLMSPLLARRFARPTLMPFAIGWQKETRVSTLFLQKKSGVGYRDQQTVMRSRQRTFAWGNISISKDTNKTRSAISTKRNDYVPRVGISGVSGWN